MTDKLKVTLDDLKARIKIAESKIDLLNATVENQNNDITKLTERKDSTDNLKQSHLQFSENFNNTVKQLYTQLDTNKNIMKEQLSLQDEKRNELKNDLEKTIQEINKKIDIINKTLDF